MNRSLLFTLLNSTAILRSPDGPVGGGGGGEPAGGGTSPSTSSSTPAPSSDAAPASSSPSGDTSTTPAPSDAAPAPLDDPFGGFEGSDSDDDEGEAPLAPQAPPPAPAAAAPPQPAAPQTPQAPVPPAADGQQAGAPPQPGQTGPQEAGAQPQMPQLPTPAEPAKMGAALLKDVTALSEHLAGTPEFALSEADIEAINTDVTTAIPKLMARTFVRAQASALAQMERVVPAMVERYMKVSQAREQSAGKFYTRWPSIDRAAHASTVDRLAAQYRSANPNATLEQMVEELGPIVMMVAKIPLQPASQTPPQQQAANGSSPRRPPSSPFVPAVGGPASPPAAQPGDDPWGGYGAVQDEE